MMTQEQRDAEIAAAQKPVETSINSADPNEIVVQRDDGKLIDFSNRKGFGQQSQKLAYPKRPGFHRHWFNDEPGRLSMARDAGYTTVLDDDGKPLCRVVDKQTGMLAYLHEVPQAWYDADLAVSQRAADEKDAAIVAGAAPDPSGRAERVGNQYGSVKLSRRPTG